MTTSKSGEPQPTETHQARDVAESFGEDPERYHRTRPRYPQDLIERIAAASPGPAVLDVGIGTGIAAEQFKAAGCGVLGVEVDERLAEFARLRGHEVEVSRFESWDSRGRVFDAVVAGQTWHWVDPEAGPVKAAEVLRPGGRIALFWNVFQPGPEVSEAIAEAHRSVFPEQMAQAFSRSPLETYGLMLDKAAEGIRGTGAFGETEQWRSDWKRSYTRDQWLDLMPTQGGYSRLPKDKLSELLAAVGKAVDEAGGSFTAEYATVAVTATRTHDGLTGISMGRFQARILRKSVGTVTFIYKEGFFMI